MSDYAETLVRQWELNDPRDRWRHTGDQPPHGQNKPISGWKPIEEIDRDIERMLVCSVCGADACFGFDVTLQGVGMGDVGAWRCAEHHPEREARHSREEWAVINGADLPADQPAREAV